MSAMGMHHIDHLVHNYFEVGSIPIASEMQGSQQWQHDHDDKSDGGHTQASSVILVNAYHRSHCGIIHTYTYAITKVLLLFKGGFYTTPHSMCASGSPNY